jgi:flagellar L-ring protein FlgH
MIRSDRLVRRVEITGVGFLLVVLAPPSVQAKKKKPQQAPDQQLSDYVQQLSKIPPSANFTLGSIWNPQGPFANLARDYKAEKVGDIVVITIAESTSAQASGAVKTGRTVSTQSGISQLLGQPGPKSGLQNILALNSNESLNGQGQTASSSTLNTNLTATVTQVLANGYLVVQAAHWVEMDNQRVQIILRGVIRSDDIQPNNTILSTQVGDLVVQVAGKGVISDGTRPFNRLTRMILKLVGF